MTARKWLLLGALAIAALLGGIFVVSEASGYPRPGLAIISAAESGYSLGPILAAVSHITDTKKAPTFLLVDAVVAIPERFECGGNSCGAPRCYPYAIFHGNRLVKIGQENIVWPLYMKKRHNLNHLSCTIAGIENFTVERSQFSGPSFVVNGENSEDLQTRATGSYEFSSKLFGLFNCGLCTCLGSYGRFDSGFIGFAGQIERIAEHRQSAESNNELPPRNFEHRDGRLSHRKLGSNVRHFTGFLTLLGFGVAFFTGWFASRVVLDGVSWRRRIGGGCACLVGLSVAGSLWGWAIYGHPIEFWQRAGPAIRAIGAIAWPNSGG
jgi:hypothetical protein